MGDGAEGEIWQDDLLSREQHAQFLEDFLIGVVRDRKEQGRQGSFVLNVDGEWGIGKSFFLQRFAKQLRGKGYVVAEINAWLDDHADDPFVSVLAAVDRAVAPYTKKRKATEIAWQAVKGSALPLATRVVSGFVKTAVRKQIGESLEDILERVPDSGLASVDQAVDHVDETVAAEVESVVDRASQSLIDQFNKQVAAVEGFRKRLGQAAAMLAKTTDAPIFILVDELDRCRPSYAIALLERMKHLFEVENVVFVFATNASQLKFSIEGAYGAGFNGYKYLRRFFERTYLLPPEVSSEFLAQKLSDGVLSRLRAPKDQPAWFLQTCVEAFALDLREVEQLADIITSTVLAWKHPVPVDLVVLFPTAVALLRVGKANWRTTLDLIPRDFSIILREGGGYLDVQSVVTMGVRDAFSLFFEHGQSLRAAAEMRNHTSEMAYVRDGFLPEWNGKNVGRTQPSLQLSIPPMVANAGRFS